MLLRAIFILCSFTICSINSEKNIPIVVTTWRFVNATDRAWDVLKHGGSALDAIEQGATVCEELQCDGTVGYGGSPDENGETTLEALIMDGKTMNVGAVASLRRIKNAIGVARRVLDHTRHSLLAGELATRFAVQMGFKEETLATPTSKQMWKQWFNEDNCQPNFWMNVKPDPLTHCGPYEAGEGRGRGRGRGAVTIIDEHNHDTIGMLAVDGSGDVAAGTSTNGARFKIPGRVGDSPIPGAGAYADNSVGAAAATGDGDLMMRFMPSFLAVEEMRRGASPLQAARSAVARVSAHFPQFSGGVVAVHTSGSHAAACHGMDTFPYAVRDGRMGETTVFTVDC